MVRGPLLRRRVVAVARAADDQGKPDAERLVMTGRSKCLYPS